MTRTLGNDRRIWTKFRNAGNVDYNRQTNELHSYGMYGNQSAGTMIIIQRIDREWDGDYHMEPGAKKYWVPAKTRYESGTRNKGGGMGAFRDIEDTDRVQEILNQIADDYK